MSGPMPKNLAATGESIATHTPDDNPQTITDIINNILTMEPVMRGFPKGVVAACNTISKAIKTAVLLIQRTRLFYFIILTLSLLFMYLLYYNLAKSLVAYATNERQGGI